MPDTIDGKTLTDGTVSEAKLNTALVSKVTNAYNTANLAYNQANLTVTTAGATFTGNVIINSPARLGLGITPNTTLHVNGTSTLAEVIENVNVSATALSANLNFDVLTQPILYLTTNATANCNLNFRGNSTVAMNTFLRTGQSVTVSLLVTNGSSARYISNVSVDSVVQTVRWAGGITPSTGNPSSIDLYSFTIVKTGTAGIYTVFGSQQRYA